MSCKTHHQSVQRLGRVNRPGRVADHSLGLVAGRRFQRTGHQPACLQMVLSFLWSVSCLEI